jgi:hypothetical protein
MYVCGRTEVEQGFGCELGRPEVSNVFVVFVSVISEEIELKRQNIRLQDCLYLQEAEGSRWRLYNTYS